jgi:hypothetical protein
MTLEGKSAKKWSQVRQVTLEEIPIKTLHFDKDHWCSVTMSPKKIVTLEFIV